MDVSKYLDLGNIFINEVIGDNALSIVIGLAAIIFLGIKLKMPFEVIVAFCLLFVAIMYEQTRILAIWVLVILSVGGIFYYIYSRLIK